MYKFKYTLATSILNRLAGLVLSAGLLLLVYWLVAIAAGVRAYAQARELLSLGAFKFVYALLLAAFVYHLAAGLRHLVWDTGRGLSRASAQRRFCASKIIPMYEKHYRDVLERSS